MSGAIYKRFLPPAQSSPRNAQSRGSISSAKHATPVSTPGSHSKKRKLEAEENGTTTSPAVSAGKNAVEVGPVADSASPRRKKEKKRKRESLVEEAPADEATPKKHKAVLSKFEKSAKRAEASRAAAPEPAEETQQEEPQEELHDLEPLPQPAPVPDAPYEPTFSTLPGWLAKPTIVESSKTVPFAELGVHDTFQKKLAKQGFMDALAVQSVLLPMLHPGFDQHLGDICVSARTGSGKTLAYLLPIVEALREQPVTKLSAIIVVPSRQLVDQALKVAEELCTGTKLKVGTALGNVPLATEQRQLVKMRAQYDPLRAQELQEQASRQLAVSSFGRGGIFEDLADVPHGHVPQYDSAVDILICTPGRLVEHIDSTTGFLLRHVRWLVIDEADQLLTQNFQGWATILTDALHGDTPEEYMSAQELMRKQRKNLPWMPVPAQRQITKVILSATMKKDLTKLGILRLRRPKLVVVEEEAEELDLVVDGDVFELPSTLSEFAVPVGDGSKKPLYLLYLLLARVLGHGSQEEGQTSASSSDSSSSDSSSDSDSDTSSSTSSPKRRKPSPQTTTTRVLIFTKSNEAASRLAHLLTALQPSLTPQIRAMTPTSTTKSAQKLLRAFATGKYSILIASDAASRGLDIPNISHVINYDMPASITSYVHRVGRTARAGRAGEAWTCVTMGEAGWFWNQVAKGGHVKRGGRRVERVEYSEKQVTWDRKREYKEALGRLQGAVEGTGEGE